MENFGIILSIPAAFLASAVYRVLLVTAAARWRWVRLIFLPASYLVLAGIVSEWILLELRGAIGTRTLLGPVYFPLHLAVFFLGTPTLVNVLTLATSKPARWWSTSLLSAALALVLVVQQYGVSEALYGIDDQGGPFSLDDRF